jgi:hypothetical protein
MFAGAEFHRVFSIDVLDNGVRLDMPDNAIWKLVQGGFLMCKSWGL